MSAWIAACPLFGKRKQGSPSLHRLKKTSWVRLLLQDIYYFSYISKSSECKTQCFNYLGGLVGFGFASIIIALGRSLQERQNCEHYIAAKHNIQNITHIFLRCVAPPPLPLQDYVNQPDLSGILCLCCWSGDCFPRVARCLFCAFKDFPEQKRKKNTRY